MTRPRFDGAAESPRGLDQPSFPLTRPGDDRCPGVLAMHEAQDGLLARIRLPGGRITADQLDAVAVLASEGNGLVEITSRANLQVRGLAAGSGPTAERLLRTAGLLPSATHERVRNVLASPFAGRHPLALATTDGLVDELDRGICADPILGGLPGKFLFGVDDGSGALADQLLDVALVAEVSAVGTPVPNFRLVVGGVQTSVQAGPSEAVATALDAARAFLAIRVETGSRAWRMRELPGGAQAVVERLGAAVDLSGTPGERRGAVVVPGICAQRDGRFAVTALAPLGQVGRAALSALAAVIREYGNDARISPWHTVTVLDVSERDARSLTRKLELLGLVVSPKSGWWGLSTCAGLGACARARADVRSAAKRRAAVRTANAQAEHWSACERRCGEPRSALVNVVATRDGLAVTSAGKSYEVPAVGGALTLLETGAPA